MKMIFLALIIVILEPMLSFAQQVETARRTFIGTNIGDGKPIGNGSATLTNHGLFTIIYDYTLENGLKNKVMLTAERCKPNLPCDGIGFWRITKAAKDYVGQMQGTLQTIRVHIVDNEIRGFSR